MSQTPAPQQLRIADYTYELPDQRIARYPLSQRDAAKLLVYKNGDISEDIFRHLAAHIPSGSVLVVNNAKVVKARMLFKKPSGGSIEVFCLEPDTRYADITTAMAQTGEVYWHCLVGGASKWKSGQVLSLESGDVTLHAALHSRNETDFTIHFSWDPESLSFAEILSRFGSIPLPPYLGRAAEEKDESSYQTLFAANEGSVAAPTASLHFTAAVCESLEQAGVQTLPITLHVGAGTFMPVKSELAGDHKMHYEWMEVSASTISRLLDTNKKPVIAGGTTALRTLESLYWIGCSIINNPSLSPEELAVDQWEPYQNPVSVSKETALQALLDWMSVKELESFSTLTGIMIAPGYQFQIADALITNFHQPQSTLLLLVSAFIGDDWKRVYEYALENDFRFLSYGDGSLLWRH